MFVEQWRENYAYAGFGAAMTFAAMRAMYTIANLCPLQTMTLKVGDIDEKYFVDPGEGPVGGFLTREQMIAFAHEGALVEDYDYWMASIENGDDCYGFVDGDRLVSYGWYSTKPTKVTGEYDICFPAEYVYMHMGHTDPDYRGRRLHGIGMAQAAKTVTEKGFAGLVSVVTTDNPFSMRSVQRLGYQLTGPILLFARFNRFAAFHSIGAKKLGVSMRARNAEQSVYLINAPEHIAMA